MFRIRIYYYADPDSGSYFSQLGSGSGVGGTLKEEYILKKVELNNFLKILLCFLGIILSSQDHVLDPDPGGLS